MRVHKFTYFRAALFTYVLMLLSTTTAQAVTPACGTFLTTDTTLDSNMICPSSTALILNGAGSNNVAIDCAGFSITTAGRGSMGISADNVTGVEIKNCNIETDGNLAHAIRLGNVTNSVISNNTINTINTFSQGILLTRSSGNSISDNMINVEGQASRVMEVANRSSNNMVTDNNGVSQRSIGVFIRASSDSNTLLQNSFESISTHAIEIHSSSDNLLDGNTLISPSSFVNIQNLWLQNGGLSVDVAGNIYAVENNFGSNGGSGGEVATLYQVDPDTGDTLTAVPLVSSGIDLGFGFDSLEIMPDGRFLATRGGNSNSLYEFNPVSGEVSLIPLTLPILSGSVNGLQAVDDSTLLATTNAGELLSIDLVTNMVTLIGQDGDGWSDLALHPTLGRLFTMSRWSFEPSGTSHLYEIDPATGLIIQEIGDTGTAFLSDIDFSPVGTLYSNNGLYTIDTISGSGTYIGGFGPDPFEQLSANNTLANQTFTATTSASVEFSEIMLPASLLLNLDEEAIQLGFNSIFVDSALFPFLDVPARITFENLGGTGRILQVDFEDDGTFEDCDPPQCTFVSFDNGILIFDVTGFTTYSSIGLLVINVEIDIKPGSDSNSINPKSKGVVPVAVLGSMEFEVTNVDVSTVTFGPAGATPAHDGHVEDVNDDGFMDAVFHFRTQETGIVCGDTEASLNGELSDGTPISGTDTVNTVGCKGTSAEKIDDTSSSAGAMSWMLLLGLGVLGLWCQNGRR